MTNCIRVLLFYCFTLSQLTAQSQNLVIKFNSFLCDTLVLTISDFENNQMLFDGTIIASEELKLNLPLIDKGDYHIGSMSIIDACNNNGMSFPFLIEADTVDVNFRDSLSVRYVEYAGSALQHKFNALNSELMHFRIMDIMLSKQITLFGESHPDSANQLLNEKEILSERVTEILKDEWRTHPENKFIYIYLSMLGNKKALDIELADSICTKAQLYAATRQIEELCSTKSEVIGLHYNELIVSQQWKQTFRETGIDTTKWILLEFWASWCSPCMKAQKSIVNLFCDGQFENVAVLSVSVKDSYEKANLVLKSHNVCWENINDPSGILLTNFGVNSIPFYVLIDEKGIVRETFKNFDKVIDQMKNQGILLH